MENTGKLARESWNQSDISLSRRTEMGKRQRIKRRRKREYDLMIDLTWQLAVLIFNVRGTG
jgi:hypothetical protein